MVKSKSQRLNLNDWKTSLTSSKSSAKTIFGSSLIEEIMDNKPLHSEYYM